MLDEKESISGSTLLDFIQILFTKLELHCEHFAPLCNTKILFHKISVDLTLIFPSLTRLGSMEPNPQSSL